MSNDKNEPAFPIKGGIHEHQFCGMTLRDYFAGQVMPECVRLAVADKAWQSGDDWWMHTAMTAYRWADMMLAARGQ